MVNMIEAESHVAVVVLGYNGFANEFLRALVRGLNQKNNNIPDNASREDLSDSRHCVRCPKGSASWVVRKLSLQNRHGQRQRWDWY